MIRYILVLVLALNITAQDIKWTESSDGTKIAYSFSGGGEMTLVFVHGWCCSGEFWKYQLPYFEESSRVVTLDLAGYGLSEPRNKYSFDSWGEDVLAVINSVGAKKYIIIGHSSGGYVALNAAARADSGLTALVGVDSYRGKLGVKYEEEFAKKYEEANRLPEDEFKEGMRDLSRWFVPESEDELIEWVTEKMMNCRVETAAQGVGEYYRYMNRRSEEFQKLSLPVYGINKSESEFDLEYFESAGIDFTPFYINKVGHFVMMDDPESFNSLLRNIISGLR